MARLTVDILGLHFPNPILCGPGPQADGEADLLGALSGGAGGLVARTVAPGPVTPPAEPSVVAYGKDGLLSNVGPSTRPVADWLANIYPKVAGAAGQRGVPLIASLTGTAGEVPTLGPALVAAGAQALEYATSYLSWHDAVAALKALRESVTVPVIAKLSLAHGEDIAERAAEVEPYVDAFTCMARFGPVLDIDVDEGGKPRLGGPDGYGWLSGTPVHPIAVRTVFAVANRTHKPVIASGGAMSTRDVIEFLQVGASLVQVTTAAIIRGPAIYGELAMGLGAWLDDHALGGVAEIQSAYLQKYGHGQRVITVEEEPPVLAEAQCIQCGICDDVCYYDAIAAPRRHLPVITAELCFQCGLCVSACPTGALSFRPRDELTKLPKP
ncbi:MAG TPA: 4Fe-4S binding protein [Symbiobacteriaceae bacterium]|jgi:dihydroorotate dehydrogenase